MNEKLIVHIDGAAQGNPGPAGIGVIVCGEDNKPIDNIAEYIGEATNNQAEYTAMIFALQEGLVRKAKSLIIKTDSELLVRQLNGEYKIKDEKLKALSLQIQRMLKGFSEVSVDHISRENNKGADKLAANAVNYAKKTRPNNKQATFFYKKDTN